MRDGVRARILPTVVAIALRCLAILRGTTAYVRRQSNLVAFSSVDTEVDARVSGPPVNKNKPPATFVMMMIMMIRIMMIASTSSPRSIVTGQPLIFACIAASVAGMLFSPLFMAALRNREGHYILPCGFFLSFFFFIPRLISAVADWMPTILPHMVWPSYEFRMHV